MKPDSPWAHLSNPTQIIDLMEKRITELEGELDADLLTIRRIEEARNLFVKENGRLQAAIIEKDEILIAMAGLLTVFNMTLKVYIRSRSRSILILVSP